MREGRLPEELIWTTMILLPKEKDKYRVIVFVEVIWKMITTIINNRLRTSISLHDHLHRSRQGRGTETAMLEAKLV